MLLNGCQYIKKTNFLWSLKYAKLFLEKLLSVFSYFVVYFINLQVKMTESLGYICLYLGTLAPINNLFICVLVVKYLMAKVIVTFRVETDISSTCWVNRMT